MCGCDQGSASTQSAGIGPPIHVVATNLSGGSLPQNARIELSFDRLLLPLSILRQTFVLNELVGGGSTTLTPTVAYDPVARVVTVTPLPDQPLVVGQSYTLFITSPQSPSDLDGLRAIDGANLAPDSPSQFTFQVTAAGSAPAQPPTVDFCRDILPLFKQKCAGTTCHGGTAPAEGLLLTTPLGVLSAVGRVANGSNMGPLAASEPPGLIFNEDMPIIDPGGLPIVLDAAAGQAQAQGVQEEEAGEAGEAVGTEEDGGAGGAASDAAASDGSLDGDPSDGGGAADAAPVDATTGAADAMTAASDATTTGSDATVSPADAAGAAASSAGASGEAGAASPAGDPGHSWIMYKLLMSVPPASDSSQTDASPSATGVYSIDCDDAGDPCPTALSNAERLRLAGLIPGREMPYPPNASATTNSSAMTLDELELMSFWIAQAAPVELTCP